MKTQKDLEKAWAKMEFNSYYGLSPISLIYHVYDENIANKVTEEGQKKLKLIQNILKYIK